MKKNVLVKIGERTEQRIIHHDAEYDDGGNVIREAWDETVYVEIPVMEARNVEMTAEEIAEFERMQAELPEPEPSPEERLDALETTTDDMILLMAELIGGK